MIKIKDERDIQDAIEEMNEYLEKRGSALYVTIVPRAFADALNEWYRKEKGGEHRLTSQNPQPRLRPLNGIRTPERAASINSSATPSFTGRF